MSKSLHIKDSYYCLLDDNFDISGWYIGLRKHHTGAYYVIVRKTVKGKRITRSIHRLVINAETDEIVDHKNGNTFDNRLCNLRIVNRSQNSANAKPKELSKYNRSSKFKGVTYVINHKGPSKWRARIRRNGKNVMSKHFITENDAALYYRKHHLLTFGEYSFFNRDCKENTILDNINMKSKRY